MVSLQVVKKKGKIVEIEGGSFSGPVLNCPGSRATGTFVATAISIGVTSTEQPIEINCTTGSHPWHVSAP